MPRRRSLTALPLVLACALPLLAQGAQGTAAEPDAPKPALNAADAFWGTDEQLRAVTESQIKVLQKLIDITRETDPEKPDLLFRMAELYAEQEHYYAVKARATRARLREPGQAPNAQLQSQAQEFEKLERQWLAKAAQQYLVLAQGPSYQSYPRMDQALFYLAYVLMQLQREDEAQSVYKRLLQDFPRSPYLPHAYVAFGDHCFDAKDLLGALAFYEKVGPSSSMYLYARYKRAWVFYNQGHFAKAQQAFTALITGTKVGGDRAKLRVVAEAKRDLPRAYAHLGACAKAWPLFQRVGGPDAKAMLEGLAEIYRALGRPSEAACAYRKLLALDPKHPRAEAWKEALGALAPST